MIRLKNNKKGAFISEAAVQWMSFLLLILVLIVFYMLFNMTDEVGKRSIEAQYMNLDTDLNLLNYLRTPVKVDGNIVSMVDLITMYNYNDNYEENLIKETQKILDSLDRPLERSTWNLDIRFMPGNKRLINVISTNYKKIESVGEIGNLKDFENAQKIKDVNSKIFIPFAGDKNKRFEISLSLECKGIGCR